MPKDKPEYYMSGQVPEDRMLATIKPALLAAPRERHLIVGEVVNMRTQTDHPDDDDDQPVPILKFVSMTAITDEKAVETVERLAAEARLNKPGQGSFDEAKAGDELAARRES